MLTPWANCHGPQLEEMTGINRSPLDVSTDFQGNFKHTGLSHLQCYGAETEGVWPFLSMDFPKGSAVTTVLFEDASTVHAFLKMVFLGFFNYVAWRAVIEMRPGEHRGGCSLSTKDSLKMKRGESNERKQCSWGHKYINKCTLLKPKGAHS